MVRLLFGGRQIDLQNAVRDLGYDCNLGAVAQIGRVILEDCLLECCPSVLPAIALWT